MKYKDLLMMSALWGVCFTTLGAKDVLSCPFEPRDQNEAEVFWLKHVRHKMKGPPLTASAIKRKIPKAVNWNSIHPVIKDWINQNQDKYYEIYRDSYVLYNDANYGIRIVLEPDFKGHKIFVNRTRWFADDAAWVYEKEPAINPATKKPWIDLSDKELKAVMRGTKKKFSDEDQQVLKDVLAIVNENFHYFYGMKFVDLRKNPDVNKEQLVGKFIPPKFFFFGEHVDMFDLSDYSEQQISLYKALGHPVYSHEGLVNSDRQSHASSNCGGKGVTPLFYKSGSDISMAYFNQANPEEINISYAAKADQVFHAIYALKTMMEGFEKVCAKHGCDIKSFSKNKTPLKKALYLIYQKTNKMVEAVITHDYVLTSKNTYAVFEEGVERLSDVVKIPGVKTLPSKTKISDGTKISKKTKVSKLKKQRRQSNERTR